jgi:hypothetical protein
MSSFKNTKIEDTGYIQLPTGSNAQRPSSPSTGYMRFNTDSEEFEIYYNGWNKLDSTYGNVVSNSLILHYDLNNTECWDGTGSTVYDLTQNGHNATLINSPTYSTNNGYKVLETNGTTSYLTVSTPNLSSTNYTVMVGSRYTTTTASTTNNSRLLNAVGNNWLLGHWYYTVDKHFAEGWITDSGYGDVTDTNWRIYTGTGDISRDIYSFYINNTLNTSNKNGSEGPDGFAFGRRGYNDGEYAAGQLSFLLVYDRVLSLSEMTQNYNYFKDRLGI